MRMVETSFKGKSGHQKFTQWQLNKLDELKPNKEHKETMFDKIKREVKEKKPLTIFDKLKARSK